MPSGEVTLNFVDADLREVVKAILGDTLGANYVMDPQVQGTVTLQTSQPVPGPSLVSVLESILTVNNAALVQSDGIYKIVPADQGIRGTGGVRTSLPPATQAPGAQVLAVPLKHVSAIEVEKILTPFAPPGGILRVDPRRNLVMIGGSRSDVASMLDVIETFDVDWLCRNVFRPLPGEFDLGQDDGRGTGESVRRPDRGSARGCRTIRPDRASERGAGDLAAIAVHRSGADVDQPARRRRGRDGASLRLLLREQSRRGSRGGTRPGLRSASRGGAGETGGAGGAGARGRHPARAARWSGGGRSASRRRVARSFAQSSVAGSDGRRTRPGRRRRPGCRRRRGGADGRRQRGGEDHRRQGQERPGDPGQAQRLSYP